jgi:hypothetical protein
VTLARQGSHLRDPAARTPNRSLFREVNERIRDAIDAFGLRPATYELVCECDACTCMAPVAVPQDVYEKVRLSPSRFLVLAGHENDDWLVAGTGGYSVVAAEPQPVVAAAP